TIEPEDKLQTTESVLVNHAAGVKWRLKQLGLVAGIAILALAVAAVIHLVRIKTDSVAVWSMTRLTNTGNAPQASISPDGKLVTYVVAEGGQQSLWIRQVATTDEIQIVPPAEVYYGGMTFSPDA